MNKPYETHLLFGAAKKRGLQIAAQDHGHQQRTKLKKYKQHTQTLCTKSNNPHRLLMG